MNIYFSSVKRMSRTAFVVGFSILFLSLPLVVAGPVAAIDIINPACVDSSGSPLPPDRQPEICKSANTTENSLFGSEGVLTAVISLLSLIIGIAAVVSIIISGIRLVMSGGEPNSISSARRGILFAVIGLGIAVTAQLFVRFLLSKLP